MKLLFLTQVLDRGDAVLGFVPRWIEGLARRCERVRVVTLEAGDVAGLPANVDVRVVGRSGIVLRWLRFKSFLREALAHDGFDCVLAHMVPRYALLASRPARAHGARLFLWYTHAGVDRRLLQAIPRVEKVFTASPESLRVDTEKRVVTGHGVDLDHFRQREEENAHGMRLLSVGRLTAAKDPITILGALSILRGRGRNVRLDLVGGEMTVQDREYRERVRERIDALDLGQHVRLAGAIPYREIGDWYASAQVVVNASATGSLDKVVLEAMATGRPVVSCNPAATAVLAELGDSAPACAFGQGDAEELASRLDAWLALSPSERHAIGARLRAIVARDHEVEQLMQRLVREMSPGAARSGGGVA